MCDCLLCERACACVRVHRPRLAQLPPAAELCSLRSALGRLYLVTIKFAFVTTGAVTCWSVDYAALLLA